MRCLVDDQHTGLMLTSMLTDCGRDLIESGSCVSDGPAAIVGEVCGTPDLYRWVDRNPAVHLTDGLHTHSLPALATRANLVSINSTLEVDLYGQLNSEVLRSGQAGGIGGSLDFMIGAQFPGNTSIIALPSRHPGRLPHRPAHLPGPRDSTAVVGAVRRHRVRRGRPEVPLGGPTSRSAGECRAS